MDLSQLHDELQRANIFSFDKFEIHMVMLKNTIVWDVMLCSLLEVYEHSEEHTASIFRVKKKAEQENNKTASRAPM
jgi:hypothetical protein